MYIFKRKKCLKKEVDKIYVCDLILTYSKRCNVRIIKERYIPNEPYMVYEVLYEGNFLVMPSYLYYQKEVVYWDIVYDCGKFLEICIKGD